MKSLLDVCILFISVSVLTGLIIDLYLDMVNGNNNIKHINGEDNE